MAQKMIKAAALAGFALAAASTAFATPISYTEVGDAGDIVTGTVQTVTGAAGSTVTSINGALTANGGGITDGDAYKIYISSPSAFSASTTGFTPGVNSFDSELFLFNLNGTGIVMNDDDPGGSGSQSSITAGNAFTAGLSAGYYYLLITGSGMDPSSAGSLIFPSWTDGSDATGVYGPKAGAGAITGFGGSSNEGGAYSIALKGVGIAPAVGTVPEPGTLWLGLTAGLTLLAAVRRRAGKPDAQ
ncbi:hypothetical protein [Scleromatobacter humisilvae]|uniref:PEP-CTERM protein-sorting domain-containing protein n=1 Tax=Scleromatobacter humisilvae TaxID=2897159 RepID=A0A9X2C3X5_9BURK|nr:hypothetical protein [Scleromatobacter humisilvae]MCK9688220.1 hypothetical protein [Scleromatobacter humisilvae]